MIGAVKASYRFDSLFAMIKEIPDRANGSCHVVRRRWSNLVCPILPRRAHRIPGQLMTMIVSADGWGIADDGNHGRNGYGGRICACHGAEPAG